MKSKLIRSAFILVALTTAALSLKAAEIPNQCKVVMVTTEDEPELILGQFTADVAEETETRKVFPLPETTLKAIVSVYYTDESIVIELPEHNYVQDTSIRIILALSENPDDDSVLFSPEATVAEAAIVTQTIQKNLLRAVKFGTSQKGRFAVVAECRSK